MPGATVTKLPPKPKGPAIVLVTPEMAMGLLERNELNRPLDHNHVQRIARQIADNRWQFNGDTIKIAETNDVLDGQHRLWAIVEAKRAVESVIIYGIKREAFATIDTLRKPRSGADIIALSGTTRHRNVIATSLTWMLRWQRGVLENYKAPQNRIENSDVEAAFKAHPAIARAVGRMMPLRRLANVGIMAFVYYVAYNHNDVIAERLANTLIDPSGVGVDDPIFRLRCYFVADAPQRREALTTIALSFKALNAAKAGREIQRLKWASQGRMAEEFPKLSI